MKFCVNTTVKNAWMVKGFNRCFIESIPPIIYCAITLLCGLPYIIYRFKTATVNANVREKSIFFCIQIVFMLIMPVLAILRFVLQSVLLYDKIIYGYMISYAVGSTLSYLIAFVLFVQDRRYVSISSYYGRHNKLLLTFWFMAFINENLALASLRNNEWWWQMKSFSDRVEFSLWIVRYGLSFSILILGLSAPALIISKRTMNRYSYLVNIEDDEEIEIEETPSKLQTIMKKCKLIYEATWPRESYLLQFKILLCILILIVGRVLNVYTPLTYKHVVDSLTLTKHRNVSQYESYLNKPLFELLCNPSSIRVRFSRTGLVFRWDLIVFFVLLRMCHGAATGGNGLLNSMKTQLWIRVQQYSSLKINVIMYHQLHSLSLRWHLSRRTGEVLRIMDRGTDSLQNILNYVFFQVAPTLVDIVIGIIYFASAFNGYFALIVLATIMLYLAGTIIVTEWRTKFRRTMNMLDNAKTAKVVDALLNYETVKYYGLENHEVQLYKKSFVEFQSYEWLSLTTLNVLNLVQSLTINLGFLGGALLCAFYVVSGKGFTVGDFVLYCTYLNQLNAPLSSFGNYYRTIQKSFIDMENMFDLLEIRPDVQDIPNAPNLTVNEGVVEFKDVCFGYHAEKPTLKNITFTIPGGQTYALVGDSGGGKSTIIRLLFRFYDVTSGAIIIDGQNISEVTQSSLRQNIGVVPQDTVLFNQTIRENIRYGRIEATDSEVEEAAAAADIHKRILSFPDRYDTMVGERGLKLSGGEKQRVAIARTLLKAPKIVLLDEATAALDTHTERTIQAHLNVMSVNKTCLVVAHRLSTVVHADQILVMHDGVITERGTHEQLLAIDGGIYAELWKEQLQPTDDEEPK